MLHAEIGSLNKHIAQQAETFRALRGKHIVGRTQLRLFHVFHNWRTHASFHVVNRCAPLPTSAPGLRPPLPTSAPGLRPHLPRDCARPWPHLHRDCALQRHSSRCRRFTSDALRF